MTADPEIITLADGITVEFRDQSNRYFGDFNRVFIAVEVKIARELFQHRENLIALIEPDQPGIVYRTTLEQMAVPSAEIDQIKALLIKRFLETTSHYLLKPIFVERLLAKQMCRSS